MPKQTLLSGLKAPGFSPAESISFLQEKTRVSSKLHRAAAVQNQLHLLGLVKPVQNFLSRILLSVYLLKQENEH